MSSPLHGNGVLGGGGWAQGRHRANLQANTILFLELVPENEGREENEGSKENEESVGLGRGG